MSADQDSSRIEAILSLLLEFARGNLEARVQNSGKGDALDGILESINMLGEELAASVVSKEFLENILGSMIDMLVVVNPDSTIEMANRSLCEALGYEVDELRGRPIRTIIPELEGEAVALVRSAGYLRDAEVGFRSRNGNRVPVLVNCSTLLRGDGSVKNFVLAARDLTAQRAAQRRIELLNEVLRAIRKVCQLLVQEKDCDKLVEGVCIHLLESNRYSRVWLVLSPKKGDSVQWREGSRALKTAPSQQWLGHTSLLPPCAQRPRTLPCLMLRGELRELCRGCPREQDHSAGTPMIAHLTQGDRTLGILGVLIPEEEALQEEELSLLHEVAGDIGFALHGLELEQERLRERSRLEEQFRHAQKMEAVGRLAGGIAHDFNNTTTAILHYARFLQDALGVHDPAREDAVEIEKAATHAAALTHQLLAFSRKSLTQTQVLDLNQVLRNMERMLRRIVGEDINIQLRLASESVRLKVGEGQLEQVVANLVVNARDAMPEGGKLTIETREIVLDEHYCSQHLSISPGRYVLLCVSDTGPGMPPEVREHIFEPFYTTKKEGKGTGLGLATVYGIVKQAGGEVWLYSEVGQGTTFKIYFPLLEGTEPLQEPRSLQPQPVASETILLVEDEEPVRKIAKRLLERQGYSVIDAGSGGDGLVLFERFQAKIDLVLTDVVLPGMSGKVFVDKLRLLRPNLPAVFMSGYTDDAIVHHGVLEPGTLFVQKPFALSDLLEKLREALRRSRAPRPSW